MISLHMHELVLLAAMAGVEELPHLPDPFQGWLAAEVKEALATARASLEARGLIRQQPDGRFTLAGEAAPVLAACLQPEVSLLATGAAAGHPPEVRRFRIAGEMALELKVGWPEDSTCTLIPLSGADAVSQAVADFFGWANLASPGPGGGTLPAVRLAEARTLAAEAGAEAGRALLEQAGLEPAVAAALTETLREPAGTGTLVGLCRQDEGWVARGFGLLMGKQGLWLLRARARAGVDWLEVQPADPAAVRAEVETLLVGGSRDRG